jgi:integrase
MQARSYTVNYSNSESVFCTRYPALAHLPFILDSRPGYHRLGNNFLTERGLGVWSTAATPESAQVAIPTPRTMSTYAEALVNFLEWAETRKVPLETCDYTAHLVNRYQPEMQAGQWSGSGQGLESTTVNLRVHVATEFLSWMSAKGLRTSFSVPYVMKTVPAYSGVDSKGHQGKKVRSRKGKAPAKTTILNMPQPSELAIWLKRIKTKFDATSELICESVVLTAMRREELACMRVDTLPMDRREWRIANPEAPLHAQTVSITIKMGVKGSFYGMDHGDKIGPTRTILIPLTLALRWDEYRRTHRNKAFTKWISGFKGTARIKRAKQSVHLFLREEDGKRFTGKDFYNVWTGVELPVPGWSPHKGRHWWACFVLWREMKKLKPFDKEIPTAILEGSALSIIRMTIQPQLGHADESTTMIYLKWVMNMLSVAVTLDAAEDEESESWGEIHRKASV